MCVSHYSTVCTLSPDILRRLFGPGVDPFGTTHSVVLMSHAAPDREPAGRKPMAGCGLERGQHVDNSNPKGAARGNYQF